MCCESRYRWKSPLSESVSRVLDGRNDVEKPREFRRFGRKHLTCVRFLFTWKHLVQKSTLDILENSTHKPNEHGSWPVFMFLLLYFFMQIDNNQALKKNDNFYTFGNNRNNFEYEIQNITKISNIKNFSGNFSGGVGHSFGCITGSESVVWCLFLNL